MYDSVCTDIAVWECLYKNNHLSVCHAAECQDEENVISDDYIVSDDYKDIDRIVKSETGINISYGKIMQSVLDDKDNSGYVKKLLIYISDVIYSEKKNVAHVLALCIASALIRTMTPLFNEKQLKETAAGVISISLITMLLSVFMGAYNLARDSVEALINIYKTICMTFFSCCLRSWTSYKCSRVLSDSYMDDDGC